jgi:hypothetical protein
VAKISCEILWDLMRFNGIYLSGSWFGTFGLLFHSVGNVIIPTDELIFFRGVGIPPTSDYFGGLY